VNIFESYVTEALQIVRNAKEEWIKRVLMFKHIPLTPVNLDLLRTEESTTADGWSRTELFYGLQPLGWFRWRQDLDGKLTIERGPGEIF